MIATGGPFRNTGHHGVLHIQDMDVIQTIYEEAGTGIEDPREKPQKAERDGPGTGIDKEAHGTLNL
ncbi:hypothetical protein M422DRAFT_259007 [Sphaerobolus stellatus SS14]|uniref:Uncharacterized protein n=1 Tax=Sphaerobolus stellatus (strain SS14) TaxID=990650 RepID=A0A0C9VKS7_SPHS4|nr:hypothetical protein M422DRAFT_259007 [Sphaerobolus stellatus SS14]